jgi:hypothetical protein
MLDVQVPSATAGVAAVAEANSDLFAGVAEVKAEEDPNYKEEGFPDDFESKIVIEKDDSALSYNGFLERLRRPGSRDLVDCIRRFINSVLGPR